jgi:hypothetical protein
VNIEAEPPYQIILKTSFLPNLCATFLEKRVFQRSCIEKYSYRYLLQGWISKNMLGGGAMIICIKMQKMDHTKLSHVATRFFFIYVQLLREVFF